MAKALTKENIEEIISNLEKKSLETTEKMNKKISDYDEKAKQKREQFLNDSVAPLQKELNELKTEIGKYQKIKSILE